MRTLEFNVTSQRLRKDPKCSFSHIIMGSENFLKAHFNFKTSEWDNAIKVAVFFTDTANEYMPLINNECMVPNSITKSKIFKIQMIGVGGGQKIPTNELTIRQEEP